jgi:hypothetical protein
MPSNVSGENPERETMRGEPNADKRRITVNAAFAVSDPASTATVTTPYIFPTVSLLETRLVILFHPWPYVVGAALEDSRARVPAEDRFIVPRRPDGFRALVQRHCLTKPLIGHCSRPRCASSQQCLCATLVDDPLVIGALIIVAQTRQDLAGPSLPLCGRLGKLIGDREQQRNRRLLILRLDGEDVETDTLRRSRLAEESIALRFLKRGGDTVARDWLERKHVRLRAK